MQEAIARREQSALQVDVGHLQQAGDATKQMAAALVGNALSYQQLFAAVVQQQVLAAQVCHSLCPLSSRSSLCILHSCSQLYSTSHSRSRSRSHTTLRVTGSLCGVVWCAEGGRSGGGGVARQAGHLLGALSGGRASTAPGVCQSRRRRRHRWTHWPDCQRRWNADPEGPLPTAASTSLVSLLHSFSLLPSLHQALSIF